jgi:hypothetical protein
VIGIRRPYRRAALGRWTSVETALAWTSDSTALIETIRIPIRTGLVSDDAEATEPIGRSKRFVENDLQKPLRYLATW